MRRRRARECVTGNHSTFSELRSETCLSSETAEPADLAI